MTDTRRDSLADNQPPLKQSDIEDLSERSTSCSEQVTNISAVQIPTVRIDGIDPPNNTPYQYQTYDMKHHPNPYDRKGIDPAQYSASLPHTMDNQRRVWHQESFSLSAKVSDHFGFSSASGSRSATPTPSNSRS